VSAVSSITLTHIQAFLLFAGVVSVAFGFLGRRQPRDRVRYILWTFVLFVLVGIGIGWAMYPFSR
jgi:cytochrome bd-type quinol oxidase subunit 2